MAVHQISRLDRLTVCTRVEVFHDQLFVVPDEGVELATLPLVERVHLTGAR